MGRLRIYPAKSNTIASGYFDNFNSALNPGTILWYGGTGKRSSISRFLIQFDLSELKQKINSKEINSDYISSYKLKMTNVIPDGELLDSDFEFAKLRKKVASSFDLIAFPINKSWDAGRGYDLMGSEYIKVSEGDTNLTGYSNWNSATSLDFWDEPGVFENPTASTTLNFSQHFDVGDESLDMDITPLVNDWLSGGSQNNGLAISYAREYELNSGDTRYISRFYTNNTNTGFKPYLEVVYDEQIIREDRLRVANNRTSRIFLNLFSGNTAANYFSAGTVSIKTTSNQDVITGLTPKQLTKGVYYVDILMTGATKNQIYKDVWNNITFEAGVDQQNFEQKFQILGNYYNNYPKEINQYVVDLYGISNNEILKKGELIRVYAETRVEYSTKSPNEYYGLEYRIIQNEITETIPWSSFNTIVIDSCTKEFMDLDTSWLLSNQNYTIELRVNELGTKRVLSEKVYFRIFDERD
jgi:hypothetical protein